MNLHDPAIVFQSVTKTYKLYKNQWQMVKDALGFKSKTAIETFYALKNINLTIQKGERIGLVGRNGAGKSTLLKLITGNFAPSTGNITIHGRVQALMNTGIGFHPEFSGLENIKASLLYNGLTQTEFNHAIEDIIDFVELGEFIDQPLKTYSLGMQSRLFFAVSTAIKPEILIIDEVLGAGDAYFSAKSADRMKKLTSSGCTLILVSHSTQQVLQFCDKAYWIESGEIQMEGEALNIIKAYEEYSKKLEVAAAETQNQILVPTKKQSTIQSKWLREKLLAEVLEHHTHPLSERTISRWPSLESGLKIHDISLKNAQGQMFNQVKTHDSLTIEITIVAEEIGEYDVYFVILLFTEDGRWLTRHCSEKYQLSLTQGEHYTLGMRYPEVLLGNGNYFFSTAIYKTLDLHDLSTARYYDLLSRSFDFSVKSKLKDDATVIHHPAVWISSNQCPALQDIPETGSKLEV